MTEYERLQTKIDDQASQIFMLMLFCFGCIGISRVKDKINIQHIIQHLLNGKGSFIIIIKFFLCFMKIYIFNNLNFYQKPINTL